MTTHRRLARITIDVVLPFGLDEAPLDELTVDSAQVTWDGETTTVVDFVQTSVVEAKVVLTDA